MENFPNLFKNLFKNRSLNDLEFHFLQISILKNICFKSPRQGLMIYGKEQLCCELAKLDLTKA